MKTYNVTYHWPDGETLRLGLLAPNQAKALVIAFDDLPKGCKLTNLEEMRRA